MRFLTAALILLVSVNPALAQEKSAKKQAADRVNMTEPEVIEAGDNMFGIRTAQGSAFDGATVIGLNYERMVTNNFGLGGALHYAEYDVEYNLGGTSGKFETTAWSIVFHGNMHVNIFKVKNMDTFFTGGIARSTIKGEFKGSGVTVADTKEDEFKVIAYANLRYWVNSQMGFTAMFGTGLGNFGLGFDFLF